MTYPGHVENGAVVLDTLVTLPDGAKVEVSIVQTADPPRERKPIWEVAVELANSIPEEDVLGMPTDDRTDGEDELESIDNLRLIDNGLLHTQFEVKQRHPSFFRVARESHLILYRAMIEVLRGTANLTVVTPKGKKKKDKRWIYGTDDKGWQSIEPEPVGGCRKAWRFCTPHPCPPPPRISGIPPEVLNFEPQSGLSHFYDALAMIQTECFMNRFCVSRWQRVPDEDMHTLEWLHERVRNEYEHFVPKTYAAPIADLKRAAAVCLGIGKWLVLESGNATLIGDPQQTRRRDEIEFVLSHLGQTEP